MKNHTANIASWSALEEADKQTDINIHMYTYISDI